MSSIPNRTTKQSIKMKRDIKATEELIALTPDFPFNYYKYLMDAGKAPLGQVDPVSLRKNVAIIGAGVSGMIAAYEALRMGLTPYLFEASDRIGGRFYSYRFENEIANPIDAPIAELGAMRFPLSGKALIHYFEKVGMWGNKANFPNPGTVEAPGNVVDYKGSLNYYEVLSDGSLIGENPYEYLEDMTFGSSDTGEPGLVNSNGMRLNDATQWQTGDPDLGGPNIINQELLKQHWGNLIDGSVENGNGKSFDNKSFRDLLTEANWSASDIEKFGQIGFGTGGWNTDYVNGSLELLRVMYMGLDVDHQLMLDGTTSLPQRLYENTPDSFGDISAVSVMSLQDLQISLQHEPTNKTVVGFSRISPTSIEVKYRDTRAPDGPLSSQIFDAVVYTPHVRLLDKMRYQTDAETYRQTTEMFDADMWESIMYTHYMQSSKVFQSLNTSFWTTPPLSGDEFVVGQNYRMSMTLSDRLTRGTYLVDYSKNTTANGNKGYGCFLSYTWNDDSVKLIDSDNSSVNSSWLNMMKTCLNDIYSKDDVFEGNGGFNINQKWENQPFYVCAFKNNLPGQYGYQKQLFEQFYNPSPTGEINNFILAGDDISWVAGWAEGAVTTALNAVAKLEFLFNNNVENPESPHGQFNRWKPPVAPL